MLFQTLESRTLMSVAASVGAGTLFVYGDDNPNGLSVETAASGADIVVKQYISGAGYTEFYRTKASKVQNVKIFGRGGADTITVADFLPASVTITGGAGPDYIRAGGLEVVAYGHEETGSTPDDNAADVLITGGFGECALYGQGGNDRFYMDRSAVPGTGGVDKFFGGSGNDRFYAKRDQRYGHHYDGGTGSDTIDFSQYDSTTGITISLGGNYAGGTRIGDYRERNHQVKSSVENVVGTRWADFVTTVFGNEIANAFYGMAGDDTLVGAGGNDLLDGGDGNDSIEGWGGNDTIYGGTLSDRLFGGPGNDSIRGGGGHDYIEGNNGNDKLYGDANHDTLIGGHGSDLLVGGAGWDVLDSRDNLAGNDILYGNTESTPADADNDRAWIDKSSLLSDGAYGIDNFL